MMQQLSQPLRRALALAIAAALLILVASTTLLPFLAASDALTEQIESTRDALSRLSAASLTTDAAAPKWETSLEDASKKSFVVGESQTIRIANVQTAVIQTLTAADLKPRSIRNLPPHVRAGLQLVGVQVLVGASLAQVQTLLARLDSHEPKLLVEDLQITRAAQSIVPVEGAPQLLDVRMDVFGIEPRSQALKAMQP